MNTDQGFQLQEIIGMLRRRAVLVAGVALGILLLSIFVASVLPNSYTAWTTLLVEPQTISRKLVEAGVEESDLNNRLHLMTMQILSRGRLAKVIDELKLYPEESERLTREEVISLMRADIRIEPVLPELEVTDKLGRRNTEFEINTFRLFYTGDSARTVAAVANRLANDFIDEHIKERVQVSGDTAEFIGSEIERLKGQISEVEQRIATVKNENAGSLPEDMLSNQRLLERAVDMAREARTDAALAESDRAFYQQQALVAAGVSTGGYQELTPERKLDAVRLELATARSRGFTEKHPDVIALTHEIAVLEQQVKDNADAAASGEETGNAAQMNARAEQNRAELRAQAARSDLERLNEQVEAIQKRIANTPRVAEQLAALEREYKHLFQSYQDYSAKQLEAGVAANMERRQKGEQFRILEAAFEPPEPASPNRVVIVMMGAVLGLALGAGLALLLEMADTSFHAARQIQGALHIPVLASVPRVLLASDRARIQRRRIALGVLAAGITGAVLLGSGVGYMAVNGMPGIVKKVLGQGGGEQPAGGAPAQPRG